MLGQKVLEEWKIAQPCTASLESSTLFSGLNVIVLKECLLSMRVRLEDLCYTEACANCNSSGTIAGIFPWPLGQPLATSLFLYP